VIVGIDLGTTNSAIGLWRDGDVKLIPNSLGDLLTPSAVSLGDEGQVIVGRAARDRQSTHPDRTATAFKRYMGSQRIVKLGAQAFSPEDLSALVLRSLKADAEAYLGEPVIEAVIAVPAYFNDKQRKATRRAGELAGFKVERLINEPTAAALAYGIHDRGREARFLVFDLGGGTFDVSILEVFEGVLEVRATTGDTRLGGEDFNELIIDRMRQRFGGEWGGAGRSEDALYQRLRASAERARRELTDQSRTVAKVVWQNRPYELPVTAEAFEADAAPLLARLRDPVLRSIRDSGLKVEELNEIVLVGGATRMPVVRKAVTRMFGRFPAASINPDEAIARGAAIQAGLKARDAALKEVVLTDVCPYTLGIDIGERGANGVITRGLFSPIIERNTTIPASRVKIYSTMEDNQKRIAMGIFQGESRWVADNIRLGAIDVDVPPRKAGEVSVECRFTYDINGLLEVDVHVPRTGERRQLVITETDEPPEDLAERRAALAALKVHPRETDANRAAMARAERCYEEFIGDKRQYVSGLIREFEQALDTQDPRTADAGRRDLLDALDQLEGHVFP
jgi:molecular chaperone HscC